MEPHPQQSQAPQTNGMGVAGFVCSLLGLVSCGLLAPLGVIFSLVGLRKEPRGLAIAGLIIGLVALCGWGIPIALFGTTIFGVMMVAAGLATPEFEAAWDMAHIIAAVESEKAQHGSYPSSLSGLGLEHEKLTDGWGNPYIYSVGASGSSFTLGSSGPDGVHGTGDDIDVR